MVDGNSIDKETGKPKRIKRDVINAKSEKLTTGFMWKTRTQAHSLSTLSET